MIEPRVLPKIAADLCQKLDAPPRLVAHLILVHDVGVDLVEGLHDCFPELAFDADAVTFGAATHDIGKILHPVELIEAGTKHEQAGADLLVHHGIDPDLARFARTHGAWSRETLPLEDLFVALADHIWKGNRNDELEAHVVTMIADQIELKKWAVFHGLDRLLEDIAASGDERLAWQCRFPVESAFSRSFA